MFYQIPINMFEIQFSFEETVNISFSSKINKLIAISIYINLDLIIVSSGDKN